MRYDRRKTRGRLRPLTPKDRAKRRDYNKRTHRAAKLWEKQHVVKDTPRITLAQPPKQEDARVMAKVLAQMLSRR